MVYEPIEVHLAYQSGRDHQQGPDGEPERRNREAVQLRMAFEHDDLQHAERASLREGGDDELHRDAKLRMGSLRVNFLAARRRPEHDGRPRPRERDKGGQRDGRRRVNDDHDGRAGEHRAACRMHDGAPRAERAGQAPPLDMEERARQPHRDRPGRIDGGLKRRRGERRGGDQGARREADRHQARYARLVHAAFGNDAPAKVQRAQNEEARRVCGKRKHPRQDAQRRRVRAEGPYRGALEHVPDPYPEHAEPQEKQRVVPKHLHHVLQGGQDGFAGKPRAKHRHRIPLPWMHASLYVEAPGLSYPFLG